MNEQVFEPENVFEAAVLVYADAGATLEQARDWVIMQCLEGGELSAFVYFETLGHRPDRAVMRMLSLMMTDTSRLPDVGKALAPFCLISKRRDGKAGSRKSPIIVLRDQLAALNVKRLVDGGMGVDAAISEVAMSVSEKAKIKKGRSVKEETVKKAWQEFFSGNKSRD